jgi:hypothetical protein
MQATNGLGVILENRYYGGSYPFNTSTTDELAYMTTEQSLPAFPSHSDFPNSHLQLLRIMLILLNTSHFRESTRMSPRRAGLGFCMEGAWLVRRPLSL